MFHGGLFQTTRPIFYCVLKGASVLAQSQATPSPLSFMLQQIQTDILGKAS